MILEISDSYFSALRFSVGKTGTENAGQEDMNGLVLKSSADR
jgi:hypothetical protein